MRDILLNKFRKFQKISMTSFRKEYEKPHFSPNFGTFPTFSQDQIFFSKIGLRHFSTLIKGYLDAKYLRNLMVGNMITFVTDGRTELIT